MLLTENLQYTYPGSPPLRFPDLRCGAGEHWLLLGPSGCGKTTLLHLLGGLLTPQHGVVTVGVTNFNNLSSSQLDRFRGKNIGIVFQTPHFIRSLPVGENLHLAQRLAGLPVDKNYNLQLLQRLGIGHKANHLPERLSQGERQRAGIARALVNRPALILADEPTSALDDANTAEVICLLEDAAATVHAMLLVVTHDQRLRDHFERQVFL